MTQPSEWQRIGNQIDAAPIFARADFVNVHSEFCCEHGLKHPFAMAARTGVEPVYQP